MKSENGPLLRSISSQLVSELIKIKQTFVWRKANNYYLYKYLVFTRYNYFLTFFNRKHNYFLKIIILVNWNPFFRGLSNSMYMPFGEHFWEIKSSPMTPFFENTTFISTFFDEKIKTNNFLKILVSWAIKWI